MATRCHPAAQRTMGRVIGTIVPRALPLEPATTWNDAELDWFPRVEVTRRLDACVVVVDLPGLSRDDVSVTISTGHLVIEGTRLAAADDTRVGYQRRDEAERFKRTIVLPDDVDTLRASARLSEGVLEIGIPLVSAVDVALPLALG